MPDSRMAFIFRDPGQADAIRRCSRVARLSGYTVPDDPDAWRRERGAWWYEAESVIAYVALEAERWRWTVTLRG